MSYLDQLLNKCLLIGMLLYFPCFAEEESSAKECSLPMEIRKKALIGLDEWIDKITPLPVRTFPLVYPRAVKTYQDPILEFQTFSQDYGFFSCRTPLVGVVTDEIEDITPVRDVLASLVKVPDPFVMELSVAEILSKVLAYRNLQKGMRIGIPCLLKQKAVVVDYEVDMVLDLWHEMPAFGLIPLDKEASPILLFRGSDFSFLSKKSWASFLSDLDISGTGFSAFHLARPDIHDWLEKTLPFKNKAKVMGFSLGGVLAMYTTIFEKAFISPQGSFAFNPPGVSKPIFERWKDVSSKLKIYVTQGDLVPKLGILPSPAFVLFSNEHFGAIQAHSELMTALPSFCLSEILIENQTPSP